MGFVALLVALLEEGTEGGLDEAVDEGFDDDPFGSLLAPWTTTTSLNSKELLAVGVFGGGTFGLSFGDTSLSVFFPASPPPPPPPPPLDSFTGEPARA